MITTSDARLMAVKILQRRFVHPVPDDIEEALKMEVVSAHSDGNFSIVAIRLGTEVTVGVAKRNPLDPNIPARGMRIAAKRAISKAFIL